MEDMVRGLAVFGLSIGILWHFAKKWGLTESQVAGAAKQAAGNKAVSVIQNLLK